MEHLHTGIFQLVLHVQLVSRASLVGGKRNHAVVHHLVLSLAKVVMHGSVGTTCALVFAFMQDMMALVIQAFELGHIPGFQVSI